MVHFMGLLYRIVYQQQVFFRKKEKDAAKNHPNALLSPAPSEASASSPAPVTELEAFSPEATTPTPVPETVFAGSTTGSESSAVAATTIYNGASNTSSQTVLESIETSGPAAPGIPSNTTTATAVEILLGTVEMNAQPTEIDLTSEPSTAETSVPITDSQAATIGVVETAVTNNTTPNTALTTAGAPVKTIVPTIASYTTQTFTRVLVASVLTSTVPPVQTTVPITTTTTTPAQTATPAPNPAPVNTSVPQTTSATQTVAHVYTPAYVTTVTTIPTNSASLPPAASTATQTTDDRVLTPGRKRSHNEFAKGHEQEVAQQPKPTSPVRVPAPVSVPTIQPIPPSVPLVQVPIPVPGAAFVLDVPDDADLTYHVHMKNRSTNEDVSPPVTYTHAHAPIVRSGFYSYIMNTIGTICGRTSVSPYIHVLSAGCPRNVRSDADWDSVVMDVYNQKLAGKEGPVLVMCYV